MTNGADLIGISVIMPVYNSEKTVGRAIESVLVQTYKSLELIVIDDCSTDRSRDIIGQYAEKDPRVHILYNEKNEGVSAARNHGIHKARYDWIAFLDSDDYWLPDKLEIQMHAVSLDKKSALCFTGSAFIDSKGQMSSYELHVPNKVTYEQLLSQNIISCSSVLVRRNDLLKYPMVSNPMIHEDYATWLKLLKQYQHAIGIDEALLVYQISSGSKSGNKVCAAKMQWNTYRYCEVPVWKSIVSFCVYAVRNIKKYYRIKHQL